jgi:hypothetical protein
MPGRLHPRPRWNQVPFPLRTPTIVPQKVRVCEIIGLKGRHEACDKCAGVEVVVLIGGSVRPCEIVIMAQLSALE